MAVVTVVLLLLLSSSLALELGWLGGWFRVGFSAL